MIRFNNDKWESIKNNYDLWWEGKLERPILNYTIKDAYNKEGITPPAPILSQKTCADFSFSADDIIERLDYEMSSNEYIGDAFPYVNFDAFGPGVLSAFCGARLDNSSGNVWFFADEKEIENIHIKYNPDNMWVKRIKEIYEAGIKRWGKNVVMGMPDLGGVLDVLAVFRGTENLLMDLYDSPEEVLRVISEIERAWFEAYEDFSSVLQPVYCGRYSDWSGIFSSKPSYIIQCDFSYMISTDMFKQFALDNLKHFCKKLPNTIYHLDGEGEIKHLDEILNIKELDAVQWQPGAWAPKKGEWDKVYKQIQAGGKNMMVMHGAGEFLNAYDAVGSAKGIYQCEVITKDKGAEYIAVMEKFGVV